MTNNTRVLYDDLTLEDDRSLSYLGKPFTGIAYETNLAGIVVSEQRFENGYKKGVGREWDDAGRLRKEQYYFYDWRHGITKCWHDNGQLESEAEYSYGIKTSERVWDSQGKLLKNWTLPEDHEDRARIEQKRKWYGD